MGKLAERLADPQRSGVYRVESTEALEEAARLNGFALVRVALDGGLPSFRLPEEGGVRLFSGFEDTLRADPGALEPLLAELGTAAAGCRKRGVRFFAAFLDPSGLLPLAPLYKWRKN